jgi:hypothetical protein
VQAACCATLRCVYVCAAFMAARLQLCFLILRLTIPVLPDKIKIN